MGINKLMEAEQEAQKIIASARADKKAKLVRAQVEAEAEIKKYQNMKMEEAQKEKDKATVEQNAAQTDAKFDTGFNVASQIAKAGTAGSQLGAAGQAAQCAAGTCRAG